jgi:two-component system, cell cycle response regulator DivK
MDLNIPIKNGMECSKEIRAHKDEHISSIPIIAVTGNANNYTMEDFKEVGINEYLPKPLDFDMLVQTVKKHTGEL